MRYESSPANVLIANINLAPLVDVLLVLLALVITTLPMASTAVIQPFQQRTACPPGLGQSTPVPVDLRIDAVGGLFWSDRPLDDAALRQVLARARQLPEARQPSVRLVTADGTDYGDLIRVLRVVNQQGLRVVALNDPPR